MSEGIGTLKLQSNANGWTIVDNILITDDDAYEPTSKGVESSFSHNIGGISSSGQYVEIIKLNYTYINEKTQNLSNVIKEVIWSDKLEKGRAYGTKGEHEAAADIYDWMKNEIGIFTA